MDQIEVELRFMVHGNKKINGEVPYGKFISKKGKEKNELALKNCDCCHCVNSGGSHSGGRYFLLYLFPQSACKENFRQQYIGGNYVCDR